MEEEGGLFFPFLVTSTYEIVHDSRFYALTFKEGQVCACVFYTLSLQIVAFTRSVDGKGNRLDRLPDTSCYLP